MRTTLSEMPSPSMLSEQVSALPELYQPIWGHPEFSLRAARSCEDRLAHIQKAYAALSAFHKRPLRVLDLGCAQGYFSFGLASLGASVLGVDIVPENISVCRTIAAENPAANVDFQIISVEEMLGSVLPNQFDLVLGLSVFHHLVYAHGINTVAPAIFRLLEHCGAGIFECALRTEPLEWAAAQPDEPRLLFGSTPFVHELARVPTHLSDQTRPLFFVSTSLWYFGAEVDEFTRWSQESHRFVGAAFWGTRRYYFSADRIAKLFLIGGSHEAINSGEIAREANFLRSFHDERVWMPECREEGQNAGESWIVRDRIPGRLLSEYIDRSQPYDSDQVVRDILAELAVLEEHGLYHADVRLWNVLIDHEGRSHLIDFGAITTEPKDCLWPQNVFFAFFIFVWGVTTRTLRSQTPLLPAVASPYNLPEPYRGWSLSLWQLPVEKWNFAEFLRRFDAMRLNGNAPAVPMSAQHLWMAEMEQFCQIVGFHQEQMTAEMAKILNIQQEQAELLQLLYQRVSETP